MFSFTSYELADGPWRSVSDFHYFQVLVLEYLEKILLFNYQVEIQFSWYDTRPQISKFAVLTQA